MRERGKARAPSKAVLAEREACCAYLESRASAYPSILAAGRISAEVVDYVARVTALIASDLRNEFHLTGEEHV